MIAVEASPVAILQCAYQNRLSQFLVNKLFLRVEGSSEIVAFANLSLQALKHCRFFQIQHSSLYEVKYLSGVFYI